MNHAKLDAFMVKTVTLRSDFYNRSLRKLAESLAHNECNDIRLLRDVV